MVQRRASVERRELGGTTTRVRGVTHQVCSNEKKLGPLRASAGDASEQPKDCRNHCLCVFWRPSPTLA